jgi:choline/glycine/proline betaine transport protein
MANINSYLKEHTNPPVFLISAAIVVLFVAWGVLAPGNLGDIANSIMNFITVYFGWWYVAAMTGFVGFVLMLMFSPYGRIKIGKDHEEPEWSTWGWFSMLFTAGMGIGLVFYGVAEPIFHYNSPPTAEAGTTAAAVEAMNITFPGRCTSSSACRWATSASGTTCRCARLWRSIR